MANRNKYMQLFRQRKQKLRFTAALLCCLGLLGTSAQAQSVIYSTDFGSVDNVNPKGWTFTGTNMNVSSNTGGGGAYTGASGGDYLGEGNSVDYTNTSGTVMTANTATSGTSTATLQVSTLGYKNITLAFGMRISSTKYTANVTFAWSTDDVNYTPITFTPAVTNWGLATGSGLTLPSGASNQAKLYLKLTFVRTGGTGNYKIDDFQVLGGAADVTPPSLVKALARGSNQVVAVFSEHVDKTTATRLAHYSLSPSIGISSVTLVPTADSAILTLKSALTSGTTYTLTADSIADTSANMMVIAQSQSFFYEKITMHKYTWKTPGYLGTYQGMKIYNGGFSGLYSMPGTTDEFYTITDRGPNIDANNNKHAIAIGGSGNSAKLFPLPNFSPQMIHVKAAGDSLQFIEAITIKRPDSSSTTGLLNPANAGNTGEIGLADTSGKSVNYDSWGIDSEGLTAGNDNDYWVSEEYGTSVWHVRKDGKVINRYAPYGNKKGVAQPQDLPIDSIFGYRNPNKGFEGVAFTANGKVYAFIQNSILFPPTNTGLKKNTRLHRFVEIDPVKGTSRMLGYEHDKVPASGFLSGVANDKRYIGDAAAVNDHEILVLEHGISGTQSYARVYKIDINTATAISTNPLAYGGKSFEELLDSATAAANGVTTVRKTLFLDLIAAGYDPTIEKTEGLAIINDSTIAIANDNDFGVISNNADGVISPNGVQTKIYTFTVPQYKKLNLVRPVSIAAAGKTSICANDSVMLSTPVTTGATYAWMRNDSAVSSANKNQLSVRKSGTYYLTVNGVAVSNRVIVTVNPLPGNSLTAAGATTFCQGDSVKLNATAAAGAAYTWMQDGKVVNGAANSSLNATTAGDYMVKVTNASGCSVSSAAIHVTVNALPDAKVTASGAASFCQGDSMTLTAQPGLSYQWMQDGKTLNGATRASYAAKASGTYTVRVSNSTCSATSAGTMVTVNPLPAKPAISQNGDLLSTDVASGYQWYLNDTAISGANGRTYAAERSGNYSVMVTNASGCSAMSDDMKITTSGIAEVNGTESAVSIFPNPYAGETHIQLLLTERAPVRMEVYNVLGQKVRTLVNDNSLNAGTYTFTFSAQQGGYAAGMYLLKLTVNNHVTVKQLMETK